MKRWIRLCLVFAVWLAALPAGADTLHGVVIVVIDGDTVLFKPDHYGDASRAFLKIRLADIDAPEKNQAYGEAATRALSALLLNQRVELNTVATDIYGRKIAHIQMGALQVNAELVRIGFAWAYSRHNSAMKDVQGAARRARRGLWQDAAPTPPWAWRRAHTEHANESFDRRGLDLK